VVLAGWAGAYDSLAVGMGMDRALTAIELGTNDGKLPASGHLRLQRLGGGLYAVAVDVSIGSAPAVARQRLRLLVRRPLIAIADTSARTVGDSSDTLVRGRGPPAPLSRWSVADLY
jgi:hypothetical protein